MIYFYKVSWDWYEEYDPRMFWSEVKVSQEVFDGMIKSLINIVSLRLVADKYDGYIGNDEIINGVWKLLEEGGYHPVEYEGAYNLWGSGIIRLNDDEYKDHLTRSTWEKLDEHNAKVESRIFAV